MRPFEIAVAAANLFAFLALLVLRLPAFPGFALAALAALLASGVQILVEGPRWQMVPAYLLAGFWGILWLLKLTWPEKILLLPALSLAGQGIVFLALILSISLPFLLPVFQFSKPGGPYAIGTLTYDWIDESRPELFTDDPAARRELMVQIWYPVPAGVSGPRAAYIQDAGTVTPALARLMRFPEFFFTHLQYVTTNAIASAPAAKPTDQGTGFPVLIFLTGLDGFRASNTFQVEALVSQGYVAVGIDQPGAAALVQYPDGRKIAGWPKAQIGPLIMQSIQPQSEPPEIHGTRLPDGILPYFAQDVRFVLDQLEQVNAPGSEHVLAGRLDLERVGIFGISFGGETAASACLREPRLKACLIMDVWIPADVVQAGLRQPALLITRDAASMRLERARAGGWTEQDIALTLYTLQSLYHQLKGDGYYLEIPNLFHLNFTDVPYWSPVIETLGMTGPLSGQRGFTLINAYSVAFFDQYLKNQPSALLNGPSSSFPEVNFQKR